jgi:hypothetical protein
MTGRGSSLEWSSARRWPSVLRRSSGSKRKKSTKLGSLAAQERQEHEKHEGGAHQCPEVKRTGLTGGGQLVGARCIEEGEGRGLR